MQKYEEVKQSLCRNNNKKSSRNDLVKQEGRQTGSKEGRKEKQSEKMRRQCEMLMIKQKKMQDTTQIQREKKLWMAQFQCMYPSHDITHKVMNKMQIPFISFTFKARVKMVSCVYFWLEHCIPNTVSVGNAVIFEIIAKEQHQIMRNTCSFRGVKRGNRSQGQWQQ